MRLDQRLIEAAKAFLDERFPGTEGGVAAMYTDDGEVLLSTSPETTNDGTTLCHEVGALCEAYKKNKRVTATVCLYRESADADPIILAPCGICQERLMLYGDAVECAVAKESDPSQFDVRLLKELQPHNWRLAFRRGPHPG
jgi:cytidine deaminase